MSQPSPHWSAPRPAAAFAAVSGIALALLLPAIPPSAASRTGLTLPGQIPKAPPYLAGFPMPFYRTSDYRPRDGAVLAADLEGHGNVELVLSLPTGLLDVIRRDGSPVSGWPCTFDPRSQPIYRSCTAEPLDQPAYPFGAPGVGDLDGDGSQEIVTCVVSGTQPRRNILFAFRADGSNLPGWPVEVHSPNSANYTCSPAGVLMADLDGDGRLEVVRGMSDGEVQAYGGDGRPVRGWPVQLGPDSMGHLRGINADLTAADLDGDGSDEVIFAESGLEPRLVAVRGDGRFVRGFPRVLPEIVNRQAPAVGDLAGDGHPEVVQSTLPFTGAFIEAPARIGSPELELAPELQEPSDSIGPEVPAALHVLRSDGESYSPVWTRTLSAGGPWGAVIANLTGDRHSEILQQDGDLLYAFDAGGNVLAGFPYALHRDFLRADAILVSPWRVADLDGDARPDLLQAQSDIYSGSSYLRVFGLRATGQPLKGFPFEVAGLMAASNPVVADLSGDGVADLVILATEGSSGAYTLLGWDLGALLPGQAP